MTKLDISFFLGIIVGATYTIDGFYDNLNIEGRYNIVAVGMFSLTFFIFMKKLIEEKR